MISVRIDTMTTTMTSVIQTDDSASDENFIHHDTHTIRLKTWAATERQVNQSLTKTLDAAKAFVSDLDTKYKVNYVRNVDNSPKGFAFVRLADARAYNMILGKNADGTERFEIVKEDFVPPTPEEEAKIRAQAAALENPDAAVAAVWDTFDTQDLRDFDWGDYGSKMDQWEKEKEKILGALVQKTSVKSLPPLITLDGYTLSKEQGEIYKKLAIQHNEKHPDPVFNPKSIIDKKIIYRN